MEKINEEIEISRDFDLQNRFKNPSSKQQNTYNNDVDLNNFRDGIHPSLKANNFMNKHLYLKKINYGSISY